MRTLVAGGAGFLGSHLVEALARRGDDVTVLDDLSTGRRSNLDGIAVEVIEADVRDGDIPWRGDRIFNLASQASPPRYQRDPVSTLLTNVVGTARLLRLASETGARYLQASTSEVYGDPDVTPQHEGYVGAVSVLGPRACYDEGKRAAEVLCYDHIRKYGTEVRVARIFNTYGPRMDPLDGRVASNFIRQALAGEPLTVYGDGSQTRSMCYVDDTIAGLLALMETHAVPGPVNIGNPEERTILQIAAAVLEVTDSSAGMEFRPLPVDDPHRRCPDITVARTLLDWSPHVGLDEGLRRTVAAWRG